jgi:hypothetical protein
MGTINSSNNFQNPSQMVPLTLIEVKLLLFIMPGESVLYIFFPLTIVSPNMAVS